MSRITNAVNTLFAKASVKEVSLIHDVSDALTFVETRMPDGSLRRHQMRVIISSRFHPSEGQVQIQLWKFLENMIGKSKSLGELAYVNYNGTLYSVDR